MGIKTTVFDCFINTIKSDKKSIYYILYYSFLESVLVLSVPLTTSFIINSLIAHSAISTVVLGSIILFVFVSITFLRLIQVYIVEKFEQKVFVEKGFEVAQKAYDIKERSTEQKQPMNKLMNYFFEITTIQKTFPIFILNGAGLVIQIIVSLTLLMFFNPYLFTAALLTFVFYFVFIIILGNNGIEYSIKRSDMKHNAIYFLQQIPKSEDLKKDALEKFGDIMEDYVDSRQNHFRVVLKQLALSFIMQGVIISGFFLFGGYLVIKGEMIIGEFIASEIIVLTLMYSINSFVKQLDYIYDGIEGYYKVSKLSESLNNKEKEHA